MLDHFGFTEESGAAAFNGSREVKEETTEEEGEMEKSKATEFRGMVARLNYLAKDSPDLQYPSKEVSREMARPKVGAWRKLKKVVRYLLGRKAVVWQYRWQDEVEYLETKSDSAWGGNREDRKSTSGGDFLREPLCESMEFHTRGHSVEQC